MHPRGLPRLLALAVLWSLQAVGAAQSNVRPVPVVAHVPELVRATRRATPAADDAALWERLARPAVPEPAWGIAMELQGQVSGGGALQGLPGEVSIQRGSWSAALVRGARDRSYTLYLETGATFHDWSTTTPFVAGSRDPFNDLYETRIGGLASFSEDGAVGWFSGFEVTLSGEDDADPLDALSIGAVTGVTARAGDELSFSFGLAALTRLEDDSWLLPYVGFDWSVTERLRLFTEGAGVSFEARLGDDWSAKVGSRYHIDQFRLNDTSVLPAGVYQDDRITATAGVSWSPSEHATLDLEAGTTLWEEHTFLSNGGATVAEFESGSAGFVGFGLRFDV